MWFDANTAWFTFAADAAPSGGFGVYAFTGMEQVCKPFEFSIELVSRSSNVDVTALLGTQACLSITDKSGGRRLVHGLIREMEQLHTANAFTHYRAALVPRLWFLGQIRDHRIFQNLSVTEIIQQILQEQGFAAEDFSFKLSAQYPAREYCVQYGETDLHFITRLCEEEGIYFYFEHTESSHCLCFCDREGGPNIPGESTLRFHPGSGHSEDTAVISRLNLHHRVNSNASTYREWNFERPRLNLQTNRYELDERAAPRPPGMMLEQYQFPHLYTLHTPGMNYAELQILRQLTFRCWVECVSDVSRYLPSYTFSIYDHPRSDVNANWWVTAVRHEGEQPGVLEHEAPAERGLRYQSVVTAIPEMTRFIPAIEHPKVRIEGLQSAIVTGPGGEEVYTDEYGRVKVQFHWDRKGGFDEKTTCWVRVADTWAGNNFGFIQVPRIGQEVMVEYMEGDPDRPVITGRVYNALKMPPWNLPGQKTLSGIQSREFKAARRNQLVLDDTEGEIQAHLSSDHNISQVNLGYLTRVDHVQGRADFRGEGFEVSTEGWGVIRANKGLYVSTEARAGMNHHQKDLSEADNNIKGAASQHEETSRLAREHQAQDSVTDGEVVASALHQQADDVHGSGKAHGELSAPHIVVSSPAGLAMTTGRSTHQHSGENAAITTGKHVSISAGRSILGSALDRVSLFAHSLGMRLFAGKGKVEIQAQSDSMDVIAAKVLHLISTQESIRITAAKEIILNAGGSYIRLGSNGIEQGTKSQWVVKAASRKMSGPASLQSPLPDLPSSAVKFNDAYCIRDIATGDPIENVRYEIYGEEGLLASGTTGRDGMVPMQESLHPETLRIKLLGKE